MSKAAFDKIAEGLREALAFAQAGNPHAPRIGELSIDARSVGLGRIEAFVMLDKALTAEEIADLANGAPFPLTK